MRLLYGARIHFALNLSQSSSSPPLASCSGRSGKTADDDQGFLKQDLLDFQCYKTSLRSKLDYSTTLFIFTQTCLCVFCVCKPLSGVVFLLVTIKLLYLHMQLVLSNVTEPDVSWQQLESKFHSNLNSMQVLHAAVPPSTVLMIHLHLSFSLTKQTR